MTIEQKQNGDHKYEIEPKTELDLAEVAWIKTTFLCKNKHKKQNILLQTTKKKKGGGME